METEVEHTVVSTLEYVYICLFVCKLIFIYLQRCCNIHYYISSLINGNRNSCMDLLEICKYICISNSTHANKQWHKYTQMYKYIYICIYILESYLFTLFDLSIFGCFRHFLFLVMLEIYYLVLMNQFNNVFFQWFTICWHLIIVNLKFSIK